MKEATLRDFFLGSVSAERLAAEVRDAVELKGARRRVHVQDLPGDVQVTITAPMLMRLCDAVLAQELPCTALEPIAFVLIVSEHLGWAQDDELVGRVLYDWASPEVTWDLTLDNVSMYRAWLTGESQAPAEPDVTINTLMGGGLVKVREPVVTPG